jgi:hypothetical protein
MTKKAVSSIEEAISLIKSVMLLINLEKYFSLLMSLTQKTMRFQNHSVSIDSNHLNQKIKKYNLESLCTHK